MDRIDDPNDGGYHAGVAGPVELRYEIGTDERPSQALVSTLSRVRGVSPIDMAPLYAHVDLEALDELLRSTDGPPRWSSCSVAISLENYELIIDGDEVVVVRPEPSNGQVSTAHE